MPGIAGIIRKTAYAGIDHDLTNMLQSLQHGRDYSNGSYTNQNLGIYVGWSYLKDSFADCMPLVSRNREIVMIFHGENFPDSDELPETKDGTRRSAQYLLDLYEVQGSSFFKHLNGFFSGLVVDLRSNEVILFNDRYGMGRLYIHQGEDEFLFASEAKALLRIRPHIREINPISLAEHLRYNCVLKNKSLFKGVSLLPQASKWVFRNSAEPQESHYFDFSEWEQQTKIQPDEFYKRYADTVSRVFPKYARDAGKVGISLTAGLDTRQIMAALGSTCHEHPCYTFDGTFGELFDSRTARKLAAVYKSPFEVIRINEQFLKDFGHYARRAVYISDGALDAFSAHDVFFNEIAREIAPVRLTGKFGSEIVRVRNVVGTLNYPRNLLNQELSALFSQLPPFRQVRQKLDPLTSVVANELPWGEYGRLAVEQSQVVMRSPYMDNELIKLMYQAPEGIRSAGDLQERYVEDVSPEFSAFMTNLGRFVSIGGLAKNNPYLTQLANILMRVLFKVEYIYLYATPHWLTRIDRSYSSLGLERFLAGRQKWEGYRIWMVTEFPEFLRDTLLTPNAHYTKYFEKDIVEMMVTQHLAGTHNYMWVINKVLSIELICSTLLDSQPPTSESLRK